jgi:predicted Zn-dependent protease
MKSWMKGLLSLLVCALVLAGWAGCATVPVTGRRQLNLLSASQEMELGLNAFQKMKKETPISKDRQINALVQKVGQRIAAVAELPNAQWEFVVFESDDANAFCLPGGKVGVYTGILPITLNEAGLATVIGHEVAHAVARHGAERVSEGMLMQTGGAVVDAALGSSADPTTASLVTLAYGLGATLGRALPHNRLQESEADHIGLIYMARAGYDPEEAVRFWERFAEYGKKKGGGAPWFLRTHPVDDVRIKQLQKLMPQALLEYRPPS